MKKRTKKKILKYTGKTLKGLGKILFVYPAKGIYYLGKKSFIGVKKINKKNHEVKLEKARPQSLAKYKVLKEIQKNKGDFTSFEKKLLTNKSTIGIILGARGTGKTAIGMRLLENFAAKSNKFAYALGFKPAKLPSWIKVIKSVDEIQNNAVLLIDEGGIEFSSRNSMSNANKFLSEILLIARHKDLSVMFIAQNSSNLEINAIRQADYLILKPSSLLQKDFERKKIRDMYKEVENDFDKLSETEGLTYLFADNYQGFVANGLPSFWTEGVSKGYSGK